MDKSLLILKFFYHIIYKRVVDSDLNYLILEKL